MGQIIGHRGAAGYAPENTMAAFEKARSLGCRFIEFDVMLSADGEAFIFHDEQLKRTTNGKGGFGLATSAYIRSLDAGSWYSKVFRGEKIPSLQDTMAWLIKADMHANIEIKPYPMQMEQTTLAVVTHINRYWPHDKPLPLVSCFNRDALALCQSIAPDIPLGLLLDKWDENWLTVARDLHCYSIHLCKPDATAERVLAMKQEGYKVYVYTINRKRQATKLLNLGVDAVFSDYPDLLA